MGIATDQVPVEQEQQEPVVEEAPPPSPEAEGEPVEAPEAGEATEAESEGPAFDLTTLDKDTWEALIRQAPKEVLESSEVVQEQVRRQGDRARTRQTEETEARQAHLDGFNQLIQAGQQAQSILQSMVRDAEHDFYDLERYGAEEGFDPARVQRAQQQLRQKFTPENLNALVEATKAGAYAEQNLFAARQDLELLSKHATLLKDAPFSQEEDKAFGDARYNDARMGKREAFGLLVDSLIDRARKQGEQQGYQKGLKDRQAQAKVAETLQKIQEAKNGTAPNVGAGRSAPSRDRSFEAVTNRIISNDYDEEDQRIWDARMKKD